MGVPNAPKKVGEIATGASRRQDLTDQLLSCVCYAGSRRAKMGKDGWHCNTPHGDGSIPINAFLVGWTSIYQLFWGSLGTRVLTHCHIKENDHDLAMAMDLSKIMATAGVAVLVLKVCGCLWCLWTARTSWYASCCSGSLPGKECPFVPAASHLEFIWREKIQKALAKLGLLPWGMMDPTSEEKWWLLNSGVAMLSRSYGSFGFSHQYLCGAFPGLHGAGVTHDVLKIPKDSNRH